MIKSSKLFETIDFSLMLYKLCDYGATYASITLLDADGRAFYSKTSSDKWFSIYMESGLYKKCHLMSEANEQIKGLTTGFTFLWDNYFPKNEESVHLQRLRQEKNISHGVAFCNLLDNGGKSIVTVAGKEADINFSKHVLRNKRKIYDSLMQSFIHSNKSA